MKSKTFEKRLFLKKVTIVNLQDGDMEKAKGGISAQHCVTSRWIACKETCDSCGVTVCGSNPCC